MLSFKLLTKGQPFFYLPCNGEQTCPGD